jgi:hypothetical protein
MFRFRLDEVECNDRQLLRGEDKSQLFVLIGTKLNTFLQDDNVSVILQYKF